MRRQKKRWFCFLPADHRGTEQYLNVLAAQGWALAVEKDGTALRVPFQQTSRRDLRYHVACDALLNKARLPEIVERKQAQGWKPIATINKLDIYESMPCRESQPHQETQNKCLLLYSLRSFLLWVFFAAGLSVLAWINQIPLKEAWYVANFSIFLRFTAPLAVVGSVIYLLCVFFLSGHRMGMTHKSGLMLRGILPVCAVLWFGCGFLALITDLVASTILTAFLILALLAAVAFCYCRFQWGSTGQLTAALSLVVSVALAIALLLHGLLPQPAKAEVGPCNWRYSLSDVVRGDALGGSAGMVEAASYKCQSSWFVSRMDYWESGEGYSLSSQVYRCRAGLFRNTILNESLQTGKWNPVKSRYDQAWRCSTGTVDRLLLQEGYRVIVITSSQPLDRLLTADSPLDFA